MNIFHLLLASLAHPLIAAALADAEARGNARIMAAQAEAYEIGKATGEQIGWFRLYSDLQAILRERCAPQVSEVTQADLDLAKKRGLH